MAYSNNNPSPASAIAALSAGMDTDSDTTGFSQADTFDAREFIVPAANESGGAMPASFRYAPEYDRVIAKVLSTKRFPYVTRGDLFRHAIDRHLKYLLRLAKDMPASMSHIDTMNEAIKSQMDMISYNQTLETLHNTINQLLGIGRDDAAKELVHTVWYQASKIADSHWRTYFQNKVADRYSHLLPSGDSIALLG